MNLSVLSISVQQFEYMRTLAEAAYPYEGCGVLVGIPGEDHTAVTEVLEGRNLVTDRRHDRYELDPRDIIRAEKQARARGEEVVGFFHTHPDHPARPSQFDADHAWAGYQYVVIAVHGGRQVRATAWRLAEENEPKSFVETELQIPGGPAAHYNPPDLVAEER